MFSNIWANFVTQIHYCPYMVNILYGQTLQHIQGVFMLLQQRSKSGFKLLTNQLRATVCICTVRLWAA